MKVKHVAKKFKNIPLTNAPVYIEVAVAQMAHLGKG